MREEQGSDGSDQRCVDDPLAAWIAANREIEKTRFHVRPRTSFPINGEDPLMKKSRAAELRGGRRPDSLDARTLEAAHGAAGAVDDQDPSRRSLHAQRFNNERDIPGPRVTDLADAIPSQVARRTV